MPSERELIRKIATYIRSLIDAVAAFRFWQERCLESAEQQKAQRLALAESASRYEETIRQAEAQHRARIAELEAWQSQTLAEAQANYEQTVKEAEQDYQKATAKAETAYRQAMDALQQGYEGTVTRTRQEHKDKITEEKQRHEQILTEAAHTYDSTLAGLQERLQGIVLSAGFSMAAFDDPVWPEFRPTLGNHRPVSVTRIGFLRESGPWGGWTMPAPLPLIGGQNVLLKVHGVSRSATVHAAQSLLLRLLASIPSAKLRFTFIDPVGLGQNAAPFMYLAYDPQLVTARAWTEPRHIEQRLAELTEHIETVIQTYLRNEYATIEEYNEQAGEIAEPYRVLVVFDFPTNFSEDAARRLLSVAQNGPRCGVYAIVLADTEKPLPHGFNLADLERASTVIAWEDERWVWEDDDFRDLTLELDAPPPPELFSKIVKTIGEASLEAGNVEVPFGRIAPPQEQWWQASSEEGVRVPLGPIGARKVQYLNVGQGTAQHALIAGRTGSGKSTLFHTLITDLALTYSPDEVTLYLVDFKKGVEFKGYATYELPHARVVAIESEREFGLSVLQGLDAELKRRGDLFRAAGVDSIADYRHKLPSPDVGRGAGGEGHMPRILLIVDEFQEFFTEDDHVATEASQVLDRLVRQGRAFGMHVILGSQTLAGAYALSRSTMDQMAVRIALQCTEADSRLILADDNPAARLLSRPGEAIYNDANGLVEGNHPFQVAWLDDDEREDYLKRIHTFADEQKYRPPQPQIVFEGNVPALVTKNQSLHDLLTSSTWPPPTPRLSAWLGEPVAIADHTAAHFRRQSASNLLIVGRDDEAAMGMISAALVSLAAQQAPDRARFYILDFSSVETADADLLARLAQGLPHAVQRGRRRQLPSIIAEIAAEVDRRLEEDEAAVAREPAIYLLIYGMQRARDLRQEDDLGYSFGMDEKEQPPGPAKQFPTILREGPDLGIHTLVWCDTTTNLTRTLDRRALREFEMRVAMQMGAEDSTNLIDTPAAGKLGLYRAYFYSEDEARLEKFRPYGLPAESWVQGVLKAMQK